MLVSTTVVSTRIFRHPNHPPPVRQRHDPIMQFANRMRPDGLPQTKQGFLGKLLLTARPKQSRPSFVTIATKTNPVDSSAMTVYISNQDIHLAGNDVRLYS